MLQENLLSLFINFAEHLILASYLPTYMPAQNYSEEGHKFIQSRNQNNTRQNVGLKSYYLSQKQPIGPKKRAEIESRQVIRTKWLIPSSRTFFRRIFTMEKAKSTVIIAMKGFHSLQSAIELSTLEGSRVKPLLSLSLLTNFLYQTPQLMHRFIALNKWTQE